MNLEVIVVNGKEIQISLTGFMEKNTGKFMKELWTHLLSAQQNASGVPQQFLDAKEEETRKKQEDLDRITGELKRTKEKEGREHEQERVKMDRDADEVKAAILESHSRRRTKFSSKWSADDKGTDERNGSKGTDWISRSPHSTDHSLSPPRGTRSRSISKSSKSRSHSRSRSLSASPKPLRHSVSFERRSHSLSRRSYTPHRVSSRMRSPFLAPSGGRPPSSTRRRLQSPSPAPLHGRSRSPARWRLQSPSSAPSRGLSRSPARRLRSPAHHRSRSPVWHRSRSPVQRRSRSPLRRRSRSPIRQRSRTPIHRRSRTPIRRRSRTPIRRRSRTPIRRRSRTPIWRRSRSFRRSQSPIRRRSQTSIRRRSRSIRTSQSPIRMSRSPIRRRSPFPFQDRQRSSYRHRSQSTVSSSPVHSRSPSLVRGRSSSPMRGRYQRAPSTPHHRSPSPVRHRATFHSRPRSSSLGNRSSSPSDSIPMPPRQGIHPSPLRRGSPKRQQRSPVRSSRDGHRYREAPQRVIAESRSPVSVRSLERDLKGRRVSHNGEQALSPSLHRSPSSSVSSPASGRSPSGESSLPPKSQNDGMTTKDHLDNVEVEESTFSRARDSEKAYKADVMNQEAVKLSKCLPKEERLNQSRSLDSDSEENDHKRKNKRKDATDDDSRDSHAENRKEAKRRRKEEKKMKKEEKRKRREERRRKRDGRRSEKRKPKAHRNASPSSDFEKSHNSCDESVLSDQKKLEIELRERALESLRAKKGLDR